MKFKHGTRRRALEYEKDWMKRWKADKTFEKSVENRPKSNSYVFYDGPPFISGVPHHGTLLSSIVKDAIPRYQTMKGKRVERVWGWDCHGLPAERFTEKKLGIHSREEVIEYGIEKYINATRQNMEQTSSLWEEYVDRIGRWVDFQGAYKTMDKEYMESIWWAFKELYEKGKIYEGEKVLMYCTLDGTPLSKAEVTMDAGAYQDVTDPSVYVKFKLHKPTKKAVAYYIQNEKNEFIAVKRRDDDESLPGVWGLAAATCSEEESLEDALKRGAKNKLGIDVLEFENQGTKRIGRHGYNLELTEYRITNYTGDPELQNGSEYYAEMKWQTDPEIFVPAAEKGSLCTAIFLDNRSIAYSTPNSVDHDINMLAWTTTPWTLPANTAIAANKDVTYVEVECDGEHLVVAKDLVEEVFTDEKHKPLKYKIVREFKGEELVGLSYQPLFADRGENAHKIWHADYVETEAGTGIVHLAPTYGEEDFQLAKKEGFPAVHTIDQNGYFTEGDWEGKNVWEVNKQIAKDLKERGVVWKIDYIRHSYPHCHRCGTKLMYRAHPSWFMDIDGQREKMLEKNESINWFPPHVKHGRFEKTVQQAPDWNISRDRFWATAMPVWKSESGRVKVVGSYAELKELSGVELDDYHRPWVDDVTFEIDGEKYTRIDKVMDSWFEAGSMPFAQFHYPFENKERFEANFPGDFIVEYIGQVRAWFYYMHAMSVALFGENSFKNVIVTGNVAGNDGRKMSKSYGNYTDPNELMDKFSADSLRFLLLGSPLLNGEDFSLQDKDVGDVARKLSMVWNMYDFFTMYAEVDGWEFDPEKPFSLSPDDLSNPLDKWIVSRVHQLNEQITVHMDAYDIPNAMNPILPFIDDASNWYVRRSRRRFWKSEDGGGKQEAYRTLHYVLMKLSVLLAPFTPFLAEELYQKLGGGNESVHLLDWPANYAVDDAILREMSEARFIINNILSMRAEKGVKVRQPLARADIGSYVEFSDDVQHIIQDEVNIKTLNFTHDTTLEAKSQSTQIDVEFELTPELRREGLMREVIRHVQSARKTAGLNVDDRIILKLATTDTDLAKAIDEHGAVIAAETLAELGETDQNQSTVKVEGTELSISLALADRT